MSKSWIILIVIAVVTMLGIIGFEFYQSLSGANVEFRRNIQTAPILPDLGTKQLDFIQLSEPNVLVKDSELEKSQVTQPAPTNNLINP